MWAMAGNDLVELSPQQIVDCDKGEDGCGGGDTVQAYGYVMHAGGLVPRCAGKVGGVCGGAWFAWGVSMPVALTTSVSNSTSTLYSPNPEPRSGITVAQLGLPLHCPGS